jgi:uncharacterized membrane protein YadS
LIERLHRVLPGILLCVAITGVAILVQAVEVYFVGQAYLEALVLAILLGRCRAIGVDAKAALHSGYRIQREILA